MNSKGFWSLAAVAAILSGCGTLGRLNEYGMDASDARFDHDGAAYTVSMHPREDTFLIRPGAMQNIGAAIERGMTRGAGGQRPGQADARAAASAFIAPSGCDVVQVRDLDASAGYWEADYVCPAGVDLRALVAAQRGALRSGDPLVGLGG